MRNLIIGSGPAAAGVALALARHPSEEVTVIDLGGRLDKYTADTVAAMAVSPPESWSADQLSLITKQPVAMPGQPLPQKRTYGSSYPFDDLGQVAGLSADATGNASAVSGAYGGFSNVWGAQIMPFSRATFTNWPVSYDEMEPHYRAVLAEVPYAAEVDDYAEHFPLLGNGAPLPPLAPRSRAVLEHYQANRAKVRALGVTVGKARLAMDSRHCVLAGLCMTGCPYDYIYSARQTFDRLRRDGRVRYVGGRLAVNLSEDGNSARVTVVDQRTGAVDTIDGDRIFVACGGMGSTRLVAASLRVDDATFDMAESMQFIVPLLSRRSSGDPRQQLRQFTLNQFNILVRLDQQDLTTSQIHCYPYNPAVLAALPRPFGRRASSWLTGQLLGRLTAGLGYLPSWASPPIRVSLRGRPASDKLPDARLSSADSDDPAMLSVVTRRLTKAGRLLDLVPVTPAVRTTGAAKSYHFGGSFPHVRPGAGLPGHGLLPSDRLGRPGPWRRIHLVDGAVLPSVPSTTFTLTVMANGHRIAAEAVSMSNGERP